MICKIASINLPDPASKEENYPIETNVPKETAAGYLGDVDTSSSGSTEPHSSDSDDSTTTTPTKGSIYVMYLAST